MTYHGILLDVEFKSKEFLENFKILGSEKSETNPWTMYKIEVPDKDIEKVIEMCQSNLVIGTYYCHFYRENEIIVVFKKKIFRVTTDKTTWKSVIEYGMSIGISPKQLDMKPVKFEDETY